MLDRKKLDEAVGRINDRHSHTAEFAWVRHEDCDTILTALCAYQRVADAAYEQHTDISTGVFGMTKLSELTKSLRDCGYEV